MNGYWMMELVGINTITATEFIICSRTVCLSGRLQCELNKSEADAHTSFLCRYGAAGSKDQLPFFC